MATGYEFHSRVLIISLTIYSERVKDIISSRIQIRIHMWICNVLFVKINDNFKKQFKTAADHSEITHIKTFLVEKPPQLPK